MRAQTDIATAKSLENFMHSILVDSIAVHLPSISLIANGFFETANLKGLLTNLNQTSPLLGHLLIWSIIFAESGLLIGFFLPGDSLLFTAGFLSGVSLVPGETTLLNLGWLLMGCFACAVIGDNVGYATGSRYGRKLFQRENSRFFKKEYLTKAQSFYEKYGKMAIVLARFTPIVRTFAPIVAGIGAMNYRTFLFFNVIGGFVWTFGLLIGGHYLGKLIPDVDKYLLPITVGVILLSFLPSVIHIYQERKANRR
jgi:membrane-associated protein